MTNKSDNLVLEHLKRIQADAADIKRDVHDLKLSHAMLLNMVGELVKASARSDGRFASLEARVERIEHRLELAQ
jgi:hypothetical protein